MKKKEVLELVGASEKTLYRWMENHPRTGIPDPKSLAGHPFPKPIATDGRAIVWDRDEVRSWWNANKEMVGRHHRKKATVTMSPERWGAVLCLLRAPHDPEKETPHQAQKRRDEYRLVRSTVHENDEIILSFDTADDAVYFKLKFL